MKFSESLKKNRDFQYVYRNGKSYANKFFIMYVLENHQERNYIGISVSKKVGNSVVRHHLCRIVREIYRLHENMFNSGLNIVVIARPNAKDVSYKEAESAFLHLSKLHGIINCDEENLEN
ncbi:MAG: ribonuclease P protein component [Lachnospiraceae bacterium]|nr:ribonuclease P protein component [Lachnospiraceae bacterium]